MYGEGKIKMKRIPATTQRYDGDGITIPYVVALLLLPHLVRLGDGAIARVNENPDLRGRNGRNAFSSVEDAYGSTSVSSMAHPTPMIRRNPLPSTVSAKGKFLIMSLGNLLCREPHTCSVKLRNLQSQGVFGADPCLII